MANVKTDYVDYALKPVGSGNPKSLRKFETYNATTGALTGTIYLKDVTDYATVGSNILASDLNTLGNAVNSNSANFASVYSPSATYAVGNYSLYNGVLYRCTTAITTPEAWNSAHWTASKLASDLNAIGNAVNSNSANFASVYSPSATYALGAYCTYQNVLYKCTAAITTPEAWNNTHWTAVRLMTEIPTISLKSTHGIAQINVPGGADVSISIAKPAGWTKITGFAFSPQPLSTWDTFLIGSKTSYGDDGNMSQQFHAIGTTTQNYNIHYTIIGY